MMIEPPNYVIPRLGIVDALSGLAADIPMGDQMPPEWWAENNDVATRIRQLREVHGIEVEDDKLTTIEPAEYAGPTRKPSPRKPRRQ